MRTRVLAVLAAALLLAVAAVLVLKAPWSAGSDDAASRWSPVSRGLCTATKRALNEDPTAARRLFYNTAHQGLHELANLTAAKDRALAAKLLEDKERVEQTLDHPNHSLPGELQTLGDDVRRAAARTGNPVGEDCASNP